jgi:hypothetical protein
MRNRYPPCDLQIGHFGRVGQSTFSGCYVSLDFPLDRVKLGHVALGGTKVQANANVHKAMSYARMREAEKKLAAEVSAWFVRAEATDAADDREHGAERRGDEMPDWVANKAARLERIRAAKVALEAEAKALPPDGDEGPGPSSGMMERTSRPQRAPDGGPPDRAQRNFTDPDSRIQRPSAE